jgi:hypothetical protein
MATAGRDCSSDSNPPFAPLNEVDFSPDSLSELENIIERSLMLVVENCIDGDNLPLARESSAQALLEFRETF